MLIDQISIEHVTIFLSKYISKSAVDMKSSLDVDRYQPKQSIHAKKPNQISTELQLCVIKCNDTGGKVLSC